MVLGSLETNKTRMQIVSMMEHRDKELSQSIMTEEGAAGAGSPRPHGQASPWRLEAVEKTDNCRGKCLLQRNTTQCIKTPHIKGDLLTFCLNILRLYGEQSILRHLPSMSFHSLTEKKRGFNKSLQNLVFFRALAELPCVSLDLIYTIHFKNIGQIKQNHSYEYALTITLPSLMQAL